MQISEHNAGKLVLIESAIKQQRVLELTLHSGKVITLLPLKLLELTGEMSIVGEDICACHMVDLCLDEVSSLAVVSSDFKLTFSTKEVEFYIKKLREVEGVGHRLVLKVSHYLEELGHPGKFQHLGSPYMTTNAEGDLIWAATVEVNFELFEWLFNLREYLTILDPTNLREEFENYCHYRENKGA